MSDHLSECSDNSKRIGNGRKIAFARAEKLKKKYGPLGGRIIRANIQRDNGNLGLALAGCRDRTKMGSYVAGINPKGSAASHNLCVGDEILEVFDTFYMI